MFDEYLKYDVARKSWLFRFAEESNNIERIYNYEAHLIHEDALREFINLPAISIGDLTNFVSKIQPNAYLRTAPHHRVMIGGREAPSAAASMQLLDYLIKDVNEEKVTPWEAHTRYEMAHPFIDGNGRSGRALWLWMMVDLEDWHGQFSFLQAYYYQTLSYYSNKINNYESL